FFNSRPDFTEELQNGHFEHADLLHLRQRIASSQSSLGFSPAKIGAPKAALLTFRHCGLIGS
ncbi:MAG TPA: hypothetical protein VMQ86_05060, partial [Bryobacteraceae bacterium]|nr:hypothetical protein [Bryobacteraceae bacterium]